MKMGLLHQTDELPIGASLKSGQYKITENHAITASGFGYLACKGDEEEVLIREFFLADLCTRNGTKVAAKKASDKRLVTQLVNNFLRDAAFLETLESRHVGKVIEVFKENDTVYMVSEAVAGDKLRDLLHAAKVTYRPGQIMRIANGLFAGLVEIHGFGMLHRDINPASIVITPEADGVILPDFGTFREDRSRASKIVSSTLRGNQDYAPFEYVAEDTDQGPASDLYCVAAVLYELITGEKPVPSLQRVSKVARGEDDPYQPLTGRITGYDARFLKVIDLCLELFRSNRLHSAGEAISLISEDGDIAELQAMRSGLSQRRAEAEKLRFTGRVKRFFSFGRSRV